MARCCESTPIAGEALKLSPGGSVINTAYDLKKPGQLWRWMVGSVTCLVLGHDWTWFPYYWTNEHGWRLMDRIFICARCQAMEAEEDEARD